jgi:hypothetical protein
MTERTVTEQQVINALAKHGYNSIHNPMSQHLMSELFPELPAHKELVKVWNEDVEPEENECWRKFRKISDSGNPLVYYGERCHPIEWNNYRRQTQAERGEG